MNSPETDLAERRYDIGIATLDLNWAKFSFSKESPSLPNKLKDQLQRYAEFQEVFPASIAIGAGRSLYAESSKNSHWMKAGLPGIKAKGIAGLGEARNSQGFYETPLGLMIVEGLKYVVSPPMPQLPFIMSDRVHIAMDTDLRLTPKISQEKFWFSLLKDGAEKEYDCQESLAKHSLGFGAIAAGYFTNEQGEAKVDGLNRQLGGVFLAHDPAAKTVSKYSQFTIYRTGKDNYMMLKPTANSEIKTPQGLIENYIQFAERIAEAKAQSVFQAGVARHSSHDGNFWYLEGKDLVQMSDNDTCLLLKDQPEEMHGVILLRDFSTYLNRTIRDLALSTFNPHFFSKLTDESCKPIHRVLAVLFKNKATPRDIEETGTAITKEYIEFIFGPDGKGGEDSKELFRSAMTYQKGIGSEDRKAGHSHLSDKAKVEWDIAHVPFYKTIISELYQLFLKSNLADQGFSLKPIDIPTFEANLTTDLKEVSRVYQDEFAKDIRRNKGGSL